jgi:hypothetical protein
MMAPLLPRDHGAIADHCVILLVALWRWRRDLTIVPAARRLAAQASKKAAARRGPAAGGMASVLGEMNLRAR